MGRWMCVTIWRRLEELHDLIERGPHRDSLVSIKIVRAGDSAGVTIERSEEL